MKEIGSLISLIAIPALILAAGAAWAEPGPGDGQGRNLGAAGPRNRMFNPKTVETLNGEVAIVDKFVLNKNMPYGVHLILKTDKETIPVHLGAGWYMEKQGVDFAAGDKVEVTGSRVTYQDKPAIIAAAVKKGDRVLKLRDASGIPAWAGQGRRNR